MAKTRGENIKRKQTGKCQNKGKSPHEYKPSEIELDKDVKNSSVDCVR